MTGRLGAAARFVIGDMLALPFRDEAFDVVTPGHLPLPGELMAIHHAIR
jgi:hypothetical protein